MTDKQDDNDFRIMTRAAARLMRRRRLPPVREEWFRALFAEQMQQVEKEARKTARSKLTDVLRESLGADAEAPAPRRRKR